MIILVAWLYLCACHSKGDFTIEFPKFTHPNFQFIVLCKDSYRYGQNTIPTLIFEDLKPVKKSKIIRIS